MLNRIVKILLIIVLTLIAIFLIKNNNKKTESWEFVGYQYKWNTDYVDNNGLKTEKECIGYGNDWLKKQDSSEALFTCSNTNNCRDLGFGNGMKVCDQVCEYGKYGLIRCRR